MRNRGQHIGEGRNGATQAAVAPEAAVAPSSTGGARREGLPPCGGAEIRGDRKADAEEERDARKQSQKDLQSVRRLHIYIWIVTYGCVSKGKRICKACGDCIYMCGCTKIHCIYTYICTDT